VPLAQPPDSYSTCLAHLANARSVMGRFIYTPSPTNAYRCLGCLDADMAPGERIPWVGLDPDASGSSAPVWIGVAKARGLRRLPALNVCQSHAVVVALHHDRILEPDSGDERRPGTVSLHRRLVEVHVPDAVPSLNLVDGTRSVLEE